MKQFMILISTVLIILIGSTVASTSSPDSQLAEFIKSSKTVQGGNDIVMTINGKSILHSEYLVAVELQKENIKKLTNTKEKLNKTAVNSSENSKYLKKINQKIQLGENQLALAYLVHQYAIVDEAQNKGMLVSLEEAKQFAANVRKTYENDPYAEGKDFISVLGDEYYWNEYAPQKYQIYLSEAKLKKSVATSSNKLENEKNWDQYLFNLVKSSNIEIKDPSLKLDKNNLLKIAESYNQ
jgi:hypothetical protein